MKQHLISNKKNSLKIIFKKFLFPYYPLHLFKSIPLLSFISFLFALHIILVYIGFNIPLINLQVGFDWIPTYLAGWFFGPIIGPIFGFIANTIYWLQTGGVMWYWLYAIQEPIVGLFASFISFYFYVTLNNKKIFLDILFQQIIFLIFISFSLFIIISSYLSNIKINNYSIDENMQLKNLLIASLSIFFIFLLIFEFFVFYRIKRKQNLINLKVFLFASIIITSMLFLFDVGLGPVITVDYLYTFKFIINPNVSMYIFLVNSFTQVILISIHIPLSIIILYWTLLVSIKSFEHIKKANFYKKQI